MTTPTPFKFTPGNYGNIRQPDLQSDRDIRFGSEPATLNQFFIDDVPGYPNIKEWTLVINDLSLGGLGRIRGPLPALSHRARGETEGSPLDRRYPDSLHLPTITRQTSTPSVSITASTAPSFRADAANSGTSSTATATAPAGLTDGDLIIVVIVHDDASTSVSAVPSGWSLITDSDPGATGDFCVRSYQKIAASEGASWDWTLSASERWHTYAVAIQSPDPVTKVADYDQDYIVGSATRFYMPSSGSPAISPARSTSWDDAQISGMYRYPSSYIKQNTGMTTVFGSSNSAADVDSVAVQYVVSSPLAAQTISAQTVKIQMMGTEYDSSNNKFLAWTVYVVSSDGGTVRGTVVALRRDGTELANPATSFTNRGDSATSTSVSAQAGDYLVFEIGTGGDSASSTTTTFLDIGDAASSDLPEDSSTTGLHTYAPWIEFANAISFQSPSVSSIDLTASVPRAESLVLSVVAVDEDARTFTGTTDSGETITERQDGALAQISLTANTESVTALGDVTHTITRSAGTTPIAGHLFVIPPASYGKRVSYVNMFGYHAMALGDGKLIRESQDTTPTLATIDHDPASTVNWMGPLIIGGATADQRLCILMTSDEGRLLEDLGTTPTLNATELETNSDPGWALVQTSLFDNDIILYSNGAIRVGSRTGTINQTFTVTKNNVPNGGGGGFEIHLPGGELRAYFLIPQEDCGTSQAETQGVPMDIVSFNLYGDEPQTLDVPFWATKNGIGKSYTTMAPWQQGLICTDGFRIINHTGRPNIMNWPGDRPGVGSDGQMICRGFWIKGAQLRILVQRVSLYGGTGNSLYWMEEYDENTDSFHQISRIVDSGSVGSILGINALGSFPISKYSDILYWHDDTNWAAQLLTDLLRNPATHLNGTTGAGNHWAFESTAATTTVEGIMPFGKVPCVVTEIHHIGDPGNGATDGSVRVDIASQSRTEHVFTNNISATFYARDRWGTHHRIFPNNTDSFDRLLMKFTGTRGSNAVYTPQLLPIQIKGLVFLDGKVRTPMSVLGANWVNRFP